MGKNKKPKRKDQGRSKAAPKHEETPAGELLQPWRKPLTPYPNNTPSSSAPVTAALQRPVLQGFGPSWIHSGGSTAVDGSGDGFVFTKEASGKSSMQGPPPGLPPQPEAKFCAETFFNIKIDNDVSLLKKALILKDDVELPKPKENFRPTEPRPKGYYSYYEPWNARNYAHKIKSEFLSFHLACNDLPSVGNADFISDFENIKRIMQMKKSVKYESFICHRVGNSILVDEFDLQKLYWKPRDKFWPEFENYAREMIGEENAMTIKEERTYATIRNFETLHVFFYACLNEVMEMGSPPTVEENGINEKFSKNPLPLPEPNNGHFLRRYHFNIGKFTMSLGSNIPVFSRNGSNVLLRTSGEYLGLNDLIDVYWEQILVGAEQTFVAFHDDMILKKTDVIHKQSVFKNRKVLKKDIITEGIEMLDFLQKNVQSGRRYWLFKEPKKGHMLIDLTVEMEKRTWRVSSSYGLYYSCLLYRVCEQFKKSMKSETALSMLKHAEHILTENEMEIPRSFPCLKMYYQIRLDLKDKRPDVSEPNDSDKKHKDFEYFWQEEKKHEIVL